MSITRGVRKVSENIIQDGRALTITEEDASKLKWENIPDGTLKINPKNGLMSIKLEGETDWLPAGLKNDGTLCIIKDSMVIHEVFTITSVPAIVNGKYASNNFTYTNSDGQTRHMPITSNNELVFELEKGSYIKSRNHLEVVIDDILVRNPTSGGLTEINETRFAMSELLEAGQEVTAKYIRIFRIGNPYPRVFMDNDVPEASEIGDLWIDIDGTIDDSQSLGESIESNTTFPWDRISGKPTTLAGYKIIDKVSYENHLHAMTDIAGLTVLINSLFKKGMIMEWFGDAANVPAGWAICDGTNGTPNVDGKFTVAAGNKYALGATGGADTVILSVAQMPRHNHKGLEYIGQLGDGNGFSSRIASATNGPSSDGVSYIGGNLPHENRPPYYALYKIMKL